LKLKGFIRTKIGLGSKSSVEVRLQIEIINKNWGDISDYYEEGDQCGEGGLEAEVR
jgi:hypothetical protein